MEENTSISQNGVNYKKLSIAICLQRMFYDAEYWTSHFWWVLHGTRSS